MKEIIKPCLLQQGDKLGIISCTTPIISDYSEENIQKAYKYLEDKGFKIVEATNCRKNVCGAAGNIKERVEAIHNFFIDPEINGIMCFDGGWYTIQLLERLDYELIAKNPKPLIGFSDATCLQNAIFTKTGLVTFSGPMVVTFIKETTVHKYTWDYFEKVLISPRVPLQIESSNHYVGWQELFENLSPKPNTGWKIFRSGQACGQIIGGNLQALLSLSGTEYWPNMKGKILFLEEGADEIPPTTFDCLIHLRQMQIYKQINGLVIGKFVDGFGFKSDFTLEMILENALAGYNFPVITNVDFGHNDPLITIPIGINCSLDTSKPEIIFLESGVQGRQQKPKDKNSESEKSHQNLTQTQAFVAYRENWTNIK